MYVSLLRGHSALLALFPGQPFQQHFPCFSATSHSLLRHGMFRFIMYVQHEYLSGISGSIAKGAFSRNVRNPYASVLIFCPVIHPNNLVMSRVQLGCSALIFLITGLLWQRSCVSSLTTSPIINTHFKGVCSLCSTLYIL
jgi:hypothetical protein